MESHESYCLLKYDDEWVKCLDEASAAFLSREIRNLFSCICILNRLLNIKFLFNKFYDFMIDDL